MSTPAKVAAFALGLVAVFGAALGVGAAVGPVGASVAPMADGGHGAMTEEHARTALPAGLQISDGGYTFELAAATFSAGPSVPLSFRVTGPDGEPVTTYEESHEQELHLIAVRRDLSGFQHVHPVLGADLAVPGELAPVALPAPSPTAEVDGYEVTLDGALTAGEESQLTFDITRAGAPVTPQPYLGAAGHLVVLHAGDLAYLHVHPEEGALSFATAAPTAGTYRLFLDFRHGDVVRTAEFTVAVPRG